MKLPEMVRVRQQFTTVKEENVPQAVRRELAKLSLASRIQPGQSVALTAGSRGIANIALILRETVAVLRDLKAEPFIVPAMGSHGGATAEGQIQVLKSYGITEEFVRAPIRSSMDVVEIGVNDFGVPVYFDRIASGADHIAVIGRVKPHTGFAGAIESGLCKMMMIGLGKHRGAQNYHTALVSRPWEPFLRSVVDVVLAKTPILFGLAILENAYDETALIEAVPPHQIVEREVELLKKAIEWMPKLPFAETDLLIIDEIGKEISGSGLDTNVVGIKAAPGQPPYPRVGRILILDLSSRTHGNATGIGFADFTTTRVIEKMNYEATVVNCLTASHPEAAKLPIHFASDRRAIEAAINTVGLADPTQAKIMHIRNTLQIGELEVSANYDLSAATNRLEPFGGAEMKFDAHERLLSILRTSDHLESAFE